MNTGAPRPEELGSTGLAVREAAVRTLFRVNNQGAWSNILIERELARDRLPAPDRGLFLRLVRGCLEQQGTLDWALDQHLRRPLAGFDPWPREVLRLGAYQLLYLDIPPFAAVDTSVQLVKRLGAAHTAGLVNAVLRRLAEGCSRLPWPDRANDPAGYLAVQGSHPRWLVERWLRRFGPAGADALCAANNRPPGVTLRANLIRTAVADLAGSLFGQGFGVVPGNLAPEALHVTGGGDLSRTAEFAAGLFTIQDEASMVVARALDPLPGERIVDACAAPGGKATHLAELAADRAQVLAVDVNRAKLSQIRTTAARLGLRSLTVLEGDARQLRELVWPQGADAALIDAPCSGLGVLRRRPELRWRRRPEDLPELARNQLAILTGVAAAVRQGGRLCYSVCSFENEETDDVIADFLASAPGREWHAEGAPRFLLPHIDGTDGFFYVVLRRGD